MYIRAIRSSFLPLVPRLKRYRTLSIGTKQSTLVLESKYRNISDNRTTFVPDMFITGGVHRLNIFDWDNYFSVIRNGTDGTADYCGKPVRFLLIAVDKNPS